MISNQLPNPHFNLLKTKPFCIRNNPKKLKELSHIERLKQKYKIEKTSTLIINLTLSLHKQLFKFAVFTNKWKTVQILIKQKHIQSIVNVVNKRGFFPLLEACKRGHKETVRILLDNKANNTYQTKNNETLLTVAIDHAQFDTAQLICKREDCNWMINILKNNRCSPLAIACYSNKRKLIDSLLEHGADPSSLLLTTDFFSGFHLSLIEKFHDLFKKHNHLPFLKKICSLQDPSSLTIRSVAKIYNNHQVLQLLDQDALDQEIIPVDQRTAQQQIKLFSALMFDSTNHDFPELEHGGDPEHSIPLLTKELIDYKDFLLHHRPEIIPLVERTVFELTQALEFCRLYKVNKKAELNSKILQSINELPPYDPLIPIERAAAVIFTGFSENHVVLYSIKRIASSPILMEDLFSFTIINSDNGLIQVDGDYVTDTVYTDLKMGDQGQLNETFFHALNNCQGISDRNSFILIDRFLFNQEYPNQQNGRTHKKQKHRTCWVKAYTAYLSERLPRFYYKQYKEHLTTAFMNKVYPENKPSLWKIAYPRLSEIALIRIKYQSELIAYKRSQKKLINL